MKLRLSCMLVVLVLSNVSNAAVDFRAELKANYRVSDDTELAINFPPGSAHRTVDEGAHLEVSNLALMGHWQASENWMLFGKVDVFDLYERNPTSSDHEVSIDRLFIRYGTRHNQGLLPETTSFYGQFGKFSKFEQQLDRHLESYGLISTAFNRVEDSGVELGIDWSNGWYAKLSYTSGGPLFFRDPNALAGDNGVDGTPEFEAGLPILYDAEVEGLDLDQHPETGLGLGWRTVSHSGLTRVNVLGFAYDRELSEQEEVHGSRYGAGADLLLLEPIEVGGQIAEPAGLGASGDTKQEYGLNMWLYHDTTTVFLQAVHQDVANLKRDGWELEVARAFSTAQGLRALGIKQVVPALRYSNLNNAFSSDPLYPSPSVTWDWQKVDLGFTFVFNKALKITMEYAYNDFIRKQRHEQNNEFLATLYWRYD